MAVNELELLKRRAKNAEYNRKRRFNRKNGIPDNHKRIRVTTHSENQILMRDIYWISGLLEGEGCFGAFPRKMRPGLVISIQLGMTDRDVVERAAKILNSSVLPQVRAFGHKTYYRTAVRHTKAVAWMMTLYSLMGERRQTKIREVLCRWKEYTPVTTTEAGRRGAAARWAKNVC